MSYVSTNSENLSTRVRAIIILAGLGIWQFYQFANFKDEPAIANGSVNLWWAIAMGTVAFIAGVLVFSSFLSRDTQHQLHITAPPRATRS